MTDLVLSPPPAPIVTESAPPLFFASFLAQYSTEKSRQTMREAATRLATILGYARPDDVPWHHLRFEHTQAVRARLVASPYARVTVNKAISCLRTLLKHAWRMGLLSRDDAERAADLKPVQGEDLAPGRHVPGGEIAALWEAAASSPRDLALLTLLRFGLRRNEILGLELANVHTDGRIRFRAKGNKEREIDLPEAAQKAIASWLVVRGDAPGPLLLPLTKNGLPLYRRMTPQALRLAINRLVKKTKIPHTTAHDFRRTICGDLLDAGVDVMTVQRIVGHSSPTTTSRYDRRPAELRRKALEKIYIPTVK